MATSSLVPSIAPLVESLQRFTPDAREDKRLQLAGIGQQQDLRSAQIQQAQASNKRQQILDIANENRVEFIKDRADLDFVLKGGPEGLRNSIARLMATKEDDDPDIAEFVEFANLATTDPDEAFKTLTKNRENIVSGLSTIDEILVRSQPFTLSEGQLRFDASNKVVARGGTGKASLAQIEKRLARDIAASKTKFEQATKIRNEITKASGDFDKIIGSFDRIRAAAKDPSAAGDLALVFNFMKMLDPGSTVREGEFATAAKAAGLGERFVQLAAKVDSGEILSPAQRKDFINQADKIFKASKRRNDRTVESFVRLAKRNNIDREDVVIERGEDISDEKKVLFSTALDKEITEQDITDTLQANPNLTREQLLQQLQVK